MSINHNLWSWQSMNFEERNKLNGCISLIITHVIWPIESVEVTFCFLRSTKMIDSSKKCSHCLSRVCKLIERSSKFTCPSHHHSHDLSLSCLWLEQKSLVCFKKSQISCFRPGWLNVQLKMPYPSKRKQLLLHCRSWLCNQWHLCMAYQVGRPWSSHPGFEQEASLVQ